MAFDLIDATSSSLVNSSLRNSACGDKTLDSFNSSVSGAWKVTPLETSAWKFLTRLKTSSDVSKLSIQDISPNVDLIALFKNFLKEGVDSKSDLFIAPKDIALFIWAINSSASKFLPSL